MSDLAKLEQADRLLAEVATVAEAMQVRDLAEVARVYARKVKLGNSAINHATAIKLKAERRLADIVDAGQQAGEIAVRGPRADARDAGICGLPDLGITSQRLAEARRLRDIHTDDDIDHAAALASEQGRELSRAGLLMQADREQTVEPSPLVTEYVEASQSVQDTRYVGRFLGAVTRADDFLGFDAQRLADLLDETEAGVLTRYAASVTRFTNTFTKARRGLRVVPRDDTR